ncbi:MAG: insulinase family protein, partial [Clostridiaceae bacterium]
MTKDDIKNGFKIDKVVESEETGSTAYYMSHIKTGAELLFLKNEDENKTFGIGFKTPPTDSTGAAHIVEHSVLSGSRKYKVREPFMELLKGSMQTFLNAMTFSDMTIYPISSMNDKDFLNLTDVYLDSVFYPAMYEKKEVFMQEGWHHELLNPEDPVTYKGVVYNEMRGAYSSPERQVFGDIMRNLHPGSTYSHESGGYPYDIPNLSFENFVDFHKKYYHPSNSLIFLYGNVDIDSVLNLLNEEYLSNFEKRDTKVEMNLSDTNEKVREMDFYYAADESANDENNTYFSYSVNHGTTKDSKDVFMNALLGEILVNSESSPVKLALLEKGLGEDVFGIDSGSYFQDFGIVVKNTDIARKEEFVALVDETLNSIVENGFNKDLLLASINRTEFAMREAQGTLKGIIYFINAMSSWRYEEDPLLGLNFNSIFKELRDNLDTGYFETYIKEKILESNNKLITIHRPKFGLFTEADEKAEQELKEFKATLSQNDIDELIKTNQELIKFQTTEDSKEDKATIPHLELSDIKKEIPEIHQEVINNEDYSIFF